MAKNKSEFSVHLTDPKGKAVCIEPGEDIPSWASKLITNPLVLAGNSADESDDDEDEDDTEGDGPPPRSGKGGGVRAWRAYAAANGVDGDGLDVDGIIDALEAVGVPTE
ncbi:hypothetical protein BCA37_10755 [Mycobacterium sp. djl-10]|nr:hypothetical protein BCA37_10755 [Mycobacterium sp. djl-10]